MATSLAVIPSKGLMPALTIEESTNKYNMMVEFTKTIMFRDQDYGIIPGVQKPCLYKAGAEKLCSLFGLSPSFSLIERTEDWMGRDHGGEPFFFYFYKCTLMRGAEAVGEGDGSCNSWEKRYRYRDGKRKCPKCNAEAIIIGKREYGGGFVCFAKKGGCGAKFKDGDASITGQELTTIVNPDIAEVVNTIQKMAQKRAMVAAVLIACNASAFYTQDAEDMRVIDAEWEPAASETLEQVRDRRIKEEQDKLSKQRATPAPDPVPFDYAAMLKQFAHMKALLNKATGSDKLYYFCLSQESLDGCPPYEHANDIKTRVGGLRVYARMQAELDAAGTPESAVAD